MDFDQHDRMLLRDLAKEVAEIATRPEMVERRQRWIEHNSLRSTYPMMLIFPEGSWVEFITEADRKCHSPWAREIEWNLRTRIYTFRHFQDDTVTEAEWIENAVIRDTGWGIGQKTEPSSNDRGAVRILRVLEQPSDLKKLHFPELVYDEKATRARLLQMQDLLGDILTVRPKGVAHISYHLTSQFIYWRGETQCMMDMADNPGFVHDLMAFLEEGNHRFLKQLIEANLLSLNNDSTYHSSGGNGYTDELPKPGFEPGHVRPQDMWSSAEAQELALVSPKMHREFVMQYEKRLLEPFGLTGYGCCDDLTPKLDDVFTIPHIRRISCSPFANVDKCAEKLGGNYIFSWKPQPAHLVGDFDTTLVRNYIQHTLDVCRANHCVLEMILKDTHTTENHPERMDEWTRIARECINASA
jgi:hypothetical protein